MSPRVDLDSIDPPDYPNFDRDRERLKRSVPEPYILWDMAFKKMATATELENASDEEIAAATMRALIRALP
jgi:hypothetical protein